MLKFLKDKKKDNKGFTLVELVIVVAILAILVGILAPQYTKYVEKSRKAADAANLENLVTAFKTAASDGTDSVAKGTYVFTIDANGTKLTQDSTEIQSSADNAITKLITSFAGQNWENTKLKSSKWANASDEVLNPMQISATLVVENDGSIAVTYNPTTVKEQTTK